MGGITIPDALHICPVCEENLGADGAFCPGCRDGLATLAHIHAERANQLYSALQREADVTPSASSKVTDFCVRLALGLAFVAFWVLMVADFCRLF